MTILAGKRDKEKRKVGVFQARSRNYPILGGTSVAHITLWHQYGASRRRGSGSIARMAPDGQGLLSLPCLEKQQPAAMCGSDRWRSADRLRNSP